MDLQADSVGLALLVVLEMLAPAERLAFVLRDMFAVPFGEIARERRCRTRHGSEGRPVAVMGFTIMRGKIVETFSPTALA